LLCHAFIQLKFINENDNMAQSGKPYTPRFSLEFNLALQQLKTIVESTKDMPADNRVIAITRGLKELAPALSKMGIIAYDTPDYKASVTYKNLVSTAYVYQGQIRDFARAKAAMERVADTTALALLGTHNEDTITRYPLNQNEINALNSSSLLVVQEKSGAVTGIYHVSGDQLSGGTEYKPVNIARANQLLNEAIQSAQVRDGFNANNPAYASQAIKYQGLKDNFAKATAGYNDAAESSAVTQERQAPHNRVRPAWAQYYEIMQQKNPTTSAYKSAYDSFWNRVVNNAGEFIEGDAWVLHEQPVLLNAAKGTKDGQQYLFIINKNGVPKLFLATADLEKHAILTEIDATRALEIASAGYDSDSALKASQKFTDILKRYEYPLPESLVSTGISGTNNTKSASPGGRQSAYTYAAPEWFIDSLPNDILNKLKTTFANNPDAIKTAGALMLAPAIYEIAEKTHEAYESSGAQAAVKTASQALSQLYAAIEAGAAVSPYILPLLATPQGEITYMASILVAGMGGSQAMEAVENGTMYLWQKLAVEPLQAQAYEREQLRQQQQSALQKHNQIVDSIPEDAPLKRSMAETVIQQIASNAAQNEWSAQQTGTALQSLLTNGTSASSMHAVEPLSSPQPASHDITGP
jgi:hypothetical protein